MIGMPGTGKTTVIKKLMEQVPFVRDEAPIQLLETPSSTTDPKIRLLGVYEDDQVYSGTERLSMAVAPQAIKYLERKNDEIILGEGDRLNNKGFFRAALDNEVELHIIVLETSDAERQRRYDERGPNQKESFLKTVNTKVNNMVEAFGPQNTLFGQEPGYVTRVQHSTPDQTQTVVDLIMSLRD